MSMHSSESGNPCWRTRSISWPANCGLAGGGTLITAFCQASAAQSDRPPAGSTLTCRSTPLRSVAPTFSKSPSGSLSLRAISPVALCSQ